MSGAGGRACDLVNAAPVFSAAPVQAVGLLLRCTAAPPGMTTLSCTRAAPVFCAAWSQNGSPSFHSSALPPRPCAGRCSARTAPSRRWARCLAVWAACQRWPPSTCRLVLRNLQRDSGLISAGMQWRAVPAAAVSVQGAAALHAATLHRPACCLGAEGSLHPAWHSSQPWPGPRASLSRTAHLIPAPCRAMPSMAHCPRRGAEATSFQSCRTCEYNSGCVNVSLGRPRKGFVRVVLFRQRVHARGGAEPLRVLLLPW